MQKNLFLSKSKLSGFSGLLILIGVFLFAAAPNLALARSPRQTIGDNLIKSLTAVFNAKDLNGCLALLTDDALVTVVNPSDLANAKLTGDTFTYQGKEGTQSQLANFFNANFTNGFTIASTSVKTTSTAFSGSMQLAILDFVIETDVKATLESGKIKTLVITEKSISPKTGNPAFSRPVPGGVPATGMGQEDLPGADVQINPGLYYLFGLSGLIGLIGLVTLKRRRL